MMAANLLMFFEWVGDLSQYYGVKNIQASFIVSTSLNLTDDCFFLEADSEARDAVVNVWQGRQSTGSTSV
ncbi:transcription factor bHLH78-like [Iris pallida]|uniref:Transcription factor bHLH78-like n=1 Tax=Iris pallida TaxID=29817 RepID=A0AAX6DSJ2_IRIPA|nr:transcription factor bHLH78-like [Iris pallida]